MRRKTHEADALEQAPTLIHMVLKLHAYNKQAAIEELRDVARVLRLYGHLCAAEFLAVYACNLELHPRGWIVRRT